MKKYGREIGLAIILGGIIAFCFEIGRRIGAEGALRYGPKQILINFLWKSVVWAVVCLASWHILPNISKKVRTTRIYGCLIKNEMFVLPFAVKVLLLLLMWLPAYLAIFPGAYAYDAPTQWEQFSTGNITTHHPVLHTVMLGLCMKSGAFFFSSYNAGIAIYTIIQMLIMATIFAYTVNFLREYKCPLLVRTVVFLFFGLSPVVHLFVISSTKDTLFTGVLLLYIISVIDICSDTKKFLENRSRLIFFVLTSLGTMLLRKNGFYVVVVTLVLLVISRWRLAGRKNLLIAALIIMVLYYLVTGPVYRLAGVKEGNVGEMLSVPLQQMARTYVYHYSELDKADCELLEQYVPREDLGKYIPTVADGVKANFREEYYRNNKVAFWKIWMKWGMKFPATYVSSFLINTADYWYPKAIIDGYNVGGDIISYSRYSVGAPGKRIEMLPQVYSLYKSMAEYRSFSEKPFVFLIFSPGWYLLLTLYLMATAFVKKQNEVMLAYVIVLLLVGTALLGPIAQVRYVLILFYALPLFGALQFKRSTIECE